MAGRSYRLRKPGFIVIVLAGFTVVASLLFSCSPKVNSKKPELVNVGAPSPESAGLQNQTVVRAGSGERPPYFLRNVHNQPSLENPYGVVIGLDGYIWVADASVQSVYRFDEKSPDSVLRAGSSVDFNWPHGLALDGSGNVYVADSYNHRIQKLDSSGVRLASWGSPGKGNGQLDTPNGIALDSSGNIYVTELGNHRVQKLDSSGNWLASWGSFGTGNGQFDSPAGIALDGSGNIYVTDSGNHRIQKLNSSGDWLASWGSPGAGNGQFDKPYGVALDRSGNIYVTDNGNHRVQKLNPSGDWLTSWGSPGTGSGQFWKPTDLALDSSGNIYVAELGNRRIQVFGFNKQYSSRLLSGTSIFTARSRHCDSPSQVPRLWLKQYLGQPSALSICPRLCPSFLKQVCRRALSATLYILLEWKLSPSMRIRHTMQACCAFPLKVKAFQWETAHVWTWLASWDCRC